MNETKHVIGILCQYLNVLINTNLKPEHFRLAKFNKTEENVVEVFWNLLAKFTETPTSLGTTKSLKLFLYKQNYESLRFYCLPDDMSCGSRELLLALGFLLSTDVLQKMLHDYIETTPFSSNYNVFANVKAKDIAFIRSNIKTDTDKANAIAWMKCKIKSNRRMIDEFQEQNKKMLAKVNSSLSVSHVRELSCNEIVALKRKNYGQDFLAQTDFAMTLLENHEKWIKKQRTFWQWMNSVLDERAKADDKIDLNYLASFNLVVKNNV